MIRKSGLVATATVLMAMAVGSGIAHAGAPLIGVGTAGSCVLTGKASIKPALIFGGTVTPVNTSFKLKLGTKTTLCSGGTGDGAGVISGAVKGAIHSTGTNDCTSLGAVGLDPFDLSIKWKLTKGSPKLAPTTIHIAATPPSAINLAGPGGSIQITLTGTGTAGGSFAGNTFTAVATTDELLTGFATACGTKGLKSFSFTAVNGPSTIHD